MFLSAFPLATLQFTEKRKEKPGTRHCGISYKYQVNYQSHKLTLSRTPFSSRNSFSIMGFPGEIFKLFQQLLHYQKGLQCPLSSSTRTGFQTPRDI